jgi:uncharacterized protein DUF4430
MRTVIAALSVALIFLLSATPGVCAAPTEVNVRIEGRSETLFEGPILTEGHNVRASSDSAAPKAGRRCNGLNNGQNPTPGPTPTAASVDAMSILGEGFDGKWYAEPFEDYFVTRWGPDAQSAGNGEYWGVLVNNAFTSVGGCQYQLDAGDEVVWLYDAFKVRPILALFPAGYAGEAPPLTAGAELGRPFEVEVDAYKSDSEGTPPASPERTGAELFEGAEVAPVVVGAGGFERVDTGSSATVETDGDGRAEITFAKAGWNRIKATVAGSGGEESAVRSNRLDVCVTDPPAVTACGPLPPDDLARTPPPAEAEEPGGEEHGSGNQETGAGRPGSIAKGPEGATAPENDAPRVRLQLPRIDRSRIARGLVGLSWRVLDPGVGVQKWTISSRTLGRGTAPYVVRASGRSGSSATLRLPPGATYLLRIVITDALGRSSTAAIGKVRVPT